MDSEPQGTSDARLGAGARFGPVAALLVAALLRFHELGLRPVWTDEGSTWTASTLTITELLHRCVYRDASPPLFYLLTGLALRFGDSEWHLRLVPALASLVMVWLTYRLARLGLGRGPSTVAAFLVALSPFQQLYAQEARTYMVVAVFFTASAYVFARVQQKPGPQRWLPLVVLTAAGLWTQSIAALGAGAQGLLSVATPTGRRRFWPWAGAMAVAALLYLPWVVYSSRMAGQLGDSHWYVPPAGPQAIFKVLRAILVSPFPLVTSPTGSRLEGLGTWIPAGVAHVLVTLPPLLALLPTLPMLGQRSARGFVARLCWAMWAAPVLVVALVSLKQSLLLQRYFVFATPFVAVLFALGVTALRPLALRVVVGAGLFGLALFGLARYTHDFTKEEWRVATEWLRATAPPNRTIVLVPFDVDPLRYYLRDGRSHLATHEVAHPEEPFSARFTPRQLDQVDAATREAIHGYDEIWVIVRSANNPERAALAARTLGIAGEGRTMVEQRILPCYNAPLEVSRFVPATPSAGEAPAAAPAATNR